MEAFQITRPLRRVLFSGPNTFISCCSASSTKSGEADRDLGLWVRVIRSRSVYGVAMASSLNEGKAERTVGSIISRTSGAAQLTIQESAALLQTTEDGLADYCREKVQGYNFDKGVDYEALFRSFYTTGFQATNLATAAQEINRMLDAKFANVQLDETLAYFDYPAPLQRRRKTGCTIFLGYTSNLMSSGLREVFRFLVQHNLVDCIVTSAGGVEEDFIKCLAPTYLGDFNHSGSELRKRAINRIGNLLIPNSNYCAFEDWILPIFNEMLIEQVEERVQWTPSKLTARLGREINNGDSVYYWAWKNNIPVFCPGLTDGSLGDMLYFHKYRNSPGLTLDVVEDVKQLNDMAVHSVKTGMIILGGGLPKHHICNANLMRNGAEFSLYVNTGQEYDGSDSGAQPDEAVSWGKIKMDSNPVKVFCDATIAFPLLVAETFAKSVLCWRYNNT